MTSSPRLMLVLSLPMLPLASSLLPLVQLPGLCHNEKIHHHLQFCQGSTIVPGFIIYIHSVPSPSPFIPPSIYAFPHFIPAPPPSSTPQPAHSWALLQNEDTDQLLTWQIFLVPCIELRGSLAVLYIPIYLLGCLYRSCFETALNSLTIHCYSVSSLVPRLHRA